MSESSETAELGNPPCLRCSDPDRGALAALAEHEAQKDEKAQGESHLEQAFNEVLEVQDAERRRALLVELGRVAFVCQAQGFLKEKVADHDIIVRASVLLGEAKGVIAQDEIESAFNNRLVYAGTTEQPELFFFESKKNQIWTGFREKAQETFRFDSFGEYLYKKRPKFEVLAVPGAKGIDIAYPPNLAGFVAATRLFTLGYFDKSEIDSIGKVCDGPTNQPVNIGRFTAEKRFLDQPTGWLVIKIRESKNSK